MMRLALRLLRLLPHPIEAAQLYFARATLHPAHHAIPEVILRLHELEQPIHGRTIR
jgi:hypothetical protein